MEGINKYIYIFIWGGGVPSVKYTTLLFQDHLQCSCISISTYKTEIIHILKSGDNPQFLNISKSKTNKYAIQILITPKFIFQVISLSIRNSHFK